MKLLFSILLLIASCFAQDYGQSYNIAGLSTTAANPPILPFRFVNETMPAMSGTTRYVYADGICAGQSPCYTTAALADVAASCGDTILTHAGDTFTGNTTFTHNCSGSVTSGTGWILLKSDSGSLPAVGTRVTASDATSMPKFQTASSNTPVFQWASSAGGYRLIGLEVTCTTAACSNVLDFANALVQEDNSASTYATQPHHILIDRSYIHGTATAELRRGINFGGFSQGAVDSLIKEIHETGNDSQAISTQSSPGPLLIRNNRLEASCENIEFGGGQGFVANNVPSDITIKNNYFFKSLTWKVDDPAYAGIAWSVKNLLEFKAGRRVLIDSNVLENVWAAAQNGYAVLFTPRDLSALQGWSNSVVSDVLFQNNIILHAGSGITVTGGDTDDNSTTISNISITSNVLTLTVAPNVWGSSGQRITLTGVGTNTFLNNQTVTITTNNSVTITAPFTHGDVVSGADTGTVALTDIAPAMRGQRIKIYNNALLDVNSRSTIPGSHGGDGWGWQISDGGSDLIIDHNTVLQSVQVNFGDVWSQSVPTNKTFAPSVITNNYFANGLYGWSMSGFTAEPTLALNRGFAPYTFHHNVAEGSIAAGIPATTWPTNSQGGFVNGNKFCDAAGTTTSCYPANFNDLLNVTNCNVIDQSAPDFTGGCAITGGSPFHNAGSDGADLGANMTTLSAVWTAVRK